jgi:pimeloyl-ACP methyl ester carboxylesterase
VPRLAARREVYAVDLPGFGELRSLRFSLEDAPRFLDAWLDAAGLGAAPLVGHSLGAVVCARLAARAPQRVPRLVLASPAVGLAPSLRANALPLARAALRVRPRFAPVLLADAARARPLRVLEAGRELLAATAWREELPLITSPTLLVLGARDELVPPAAADALRAALPDARLHLIDGAGHVPMVDAPEEFGRAVLEHVG